PPYTRLHPFSMQRPPPPSTLFPYTTLFRSPVLRGPSTFFLHVVPPRRSSTFLMLDPIRRLLAEAGKAKQTRAFWQTVTDILSERSEEHTSELQSRFDPVCRLLPEKKKRNHH